MKRVGPRISILVASIVLMTSGGLAQYYGSGGVAFNNIYGAQASLGMDRLRSNMARDEFLKKMGVNPPTSAPSTTSAQAALKKPISGKYQPSSNTKVLDKIVQCVTTDPTEQKVMRELFTNAKKQLDVELKKTGRDNDLFSALTVFIVFNYNIYSGGELSDAAQEAIYSQFRQALQDVALEQMGNAERQELSESLIYMGLYPVVTLGILGDKPNETQLKQLKSLSREGLKWVLAVDPTKIVLDDKGIHAKS